MRNVLDKFLKGKRAIFKDANLFSMEFRGAGAEHPDQKSNLEGALLTKNQGFSYLLPRAPHLAKTALLDLTRAENIDNFPDVFVFNGEQTIKFLKDLWDKGQLKDSVSFL